MGTPWRTRYSTTICAPDSRRRPSDSDNGYPLRFRCNRLPLGGGRVARWGVLSTHRIRLRNRIGRHGYPAATSPARGVDGSGGTSMATLASHSAGPLPLAESPLGRTIATTATDIWNDSCAVDELEYAISYGAVGATANPTIVTDVWKGDL